MKFLYFDHWCYSKVWTALFFVLYIMKLVTVSLWLCLQSSGAMFIPLWLSPNLCLVLLFRYPYFQVGQKLGSMIQQQEALNRTKSNATLSQSLGHQHQPSALVYNFSQQDNITGRTNKSNAAMSQGLGHVQNPSVMFTFKQPDSITSGRNKGNGIISQPQSIIRRQQSVLSYGQKKDVQPSIKWDDDDEDFADILG